MVGVESFRLETNFEAFFELLFLFFSLVFRVLFCLVLTGFISFTFISSKRDFKSFF